AGLQSLAPQAKLNRNLFLLRWREGVGHNAALARLGDFATVNLPRKRPVDLVNFGGVEALPRVIAALVATVAVAMLAHTLVTSVRRRSRDLAILKTLGFVRRQVSLS